MQTTTTTSPGPSICQRIEWLVTPLAQIVTRLVFGQAFFITGKGKLENLDKIIEFFRSLHIPAPELQAPFIGGLELVGGIMLLLGLGTRVFAALLTCTMIVALVTAHPADLWNGLKLQASFADVAPLPFLVAMLWLIAKGPGKLSIDHWLCARRNRA